MSVVRFGIIGFGNFAERAIAPAIRSARNAELVAIQKRSRAAAEEKARAFLVPHAFDRVEDLVACPDVDAVFIVSANSTHAADTITAARHGKHVLVEKPMATNVRECEAMIAECARSDVRLMIGHMVRLSPAVILVRDRLRSGAIGRVTFADAEFMFDGRTSPRRWLMNRRLAGAGPLFDIGVHCLDTLRFILGEEVVGVQAAFEPRPDAENTERTSHLTLRFGNGMLGTIYTSFEVGVRASRIHVRGTEGVMTLEEFTRSPATAILRTTLPTTGGPDAVQEEAIAVPNLYVEEVEGFAASLLGQTAVPVPGEEGLKNQHVLDAALEQIAGGQAF